MSQRTIESEKMSENNFLLFHRIIAGIEFTLYAACMAAFFHPFLKEGKHPEKLRRNLFLLFLANGAAWLFYLLPWFGGWMQIMVVTLLLMAVSGFLGLERKFIFLLDAIFYCIRNLSMIMTRSVDYFSEKFFLEDADTVERIFLSASWNYLFVALIQFFLFSFLLYLVSRQLRKKELRLHAKEVCYLLLAPVTGILFVNIMLRLLLVANENEVFWLFHSFPAFLAVVPLASLFLYAGILAAIAACQRIVGLQEEREKYFMTRQQLSAMQTRIQEVEQFQDNLRRIRHEMKNHLTNIKGLAAGGHYEDMDAYLDKMEDSMRSFDPSLRTGNPVTDIIINDKRKAAALQDIDFQAQFSYPDAGGYNAYDIGIILSNLLQNALEACAKVPDGSRYIFLSGRQKKKFFLIDVRNSFNGKVLFDRHTNLPVSTKERNGLETSGFIHGIGLSNVKQEAEKYSGNLDIKIEGNEFQVIVLLQESV